MSWRTEFGPEWAVPRQITRLVREGLLLDISDSYFDAMPAFVSRFPDRSMLQLAVDHPDPARRFEPGSPRFLVQWFESPDGPDTASFSSDDEEEVGRLLRDEIASGGGAAPPMREFRPMREPEEWQP